ncbi:hypothetical protein BU23DRAFT_56756 [Bimuria novae-zelandiae CBS 107.79]|uniref:C2H2-type domain-containing protein n=1 Tax=Bimuria novae-zelandiae CBS 107.79 TaxID=1447943 RepID=A0A6A5VRN3_9PLEO|nr:hypothetical protein BU23DRAFT_56756 [Bimuria novae-zelandiae CBS 107.79]
MSPSTPSIQISRSSLHRYPLPHHHCPSPPGAMAIPRARQDVPPPLPPPRYIGEELRESGVDPGWTWGNTNYSKDTGFKGNRFGSIKPGSSLLSGAVSDAHEHTAEPFAARESPSDRSFDEADSLEHSDEDYSGKPLQRPSNHRFTSERQLGQGLLETSSHAYDKQLLSKIGGPNTPTRTTAPPLPTTSQESAPNPHTVFSKLNGQLKPLSVPDRLQQPSLDSPVSRWPPSGAVSPGYSGFRSPVFDSGSTEARQRRFGSISTPGLDDASSVHRGSYDHSMFTESEFGMEESGMRDLNINERSPVGSDEYQTGANGGLKRRASSPPSEAAREDRPTGGGNVDLYHRRSAQMLVSRNTPSATNSPRYPTFHGSTIQGSLSSVSNLSQRTASFASSFGFSAASSITSYSGDQRLSPSALSPSAETELVPVSPYAASRSLNPSPRGLLSRSHHQRGLSESEHHSVHHSVRKMSTDSILQSRQNSIASRIVGAYICECCPKKPKKFDSEEELRVHELEKQYTCQFCPNRFKNKNEAERHQNSLHLRRHSWSCAALAGVRAAFHDSPIHHGIADVCGYCGEEFPLPPNWDARAEHLNHVHKFGECNQSKKFFRADHFRQHLKHSHAGASGKWTNMLETACMKDEPPPKERVGSICSTVGLPSAPLAPKPGTINEVHEES